MSFLALALLAQSGGVAQDLQQAVTLEQQGHAAEAVAAYQKWLASNPPGPQWDETLLRMAALMSDPRKAVVSILDGLPKISTNEARHDAYVMVGELDELLGNWAGAQESYQNASLVPGNKDFSSLLESARILLQLGRFEEASGQVRSIIAICQDSRTVEEARVLSVKLDEIAGKTVDAEKTMADLLEGTLKSTLTAQNLATLYEVSVRLDLGARTKSIVELLKSRYPKSPETAVVTGQATRFPSPAALLGYGSGPYTGAPSKSGPTAGVPSGSGAAPEGTTAPTSRPTGTIAIQIGSYEDPTNADYRLQDLEHAGFHGKILKSRVGGKIYYKVIIPDVPLDKSQDEVVKLKEKGFEGFLLYD